MESHVFISYRKISSTPRKQARKNLSTSTEGGHSKKPYDRKNLASSSKPASQPASPSSASGQPSPSTSSAPEARIDTPTTSRQRKRTRTSETSAEPYTSTTPNTRSRSRQQSNPPTKRSPAKKARKEDQQTAQSNSRSNIGAGTLSFISLKTRASLC